MNGTVYILITIGISALVTMLLRFAPFLFLRGKQGTPPLVTYFGQVLPYATMAMLVVFCLKELKVTAWPYGLPELISGAVVVGLHAWKHQTLLSIIAGTVCYMVLVQTVFAAI